MVTRRDLLPGLQIAQSLHAFREFIADFPHIEAKWYEISNYITILSVGNEEELKSFSSDLSENGIRFSEFFEPDLDCSLTAVAIEPGHKSKKACRKLSLALKEYSF